MKMLLPFCLTLLVVTGCATKSPHSEFVRTTTFSSLQTFDYKHSFVSGMDFRESERMTLEELSERTLIEAFTEKGFERTAKEPDFYLVARWRKSVSSQPDLFDPIDGPLETLNRRDHPNMRFASRIHLTVEAYERVGDALFWRKELPNLFDATQFTEERIVMSLRRAVANFPLRVEKDPDLLDIQ